MPIYRYAHSCGFEQQLFLKIDKEYVTIPCYRCGRQVTAKQIRDKSVDVKQIDDGIGVLKKNDKKPRGR